MLWIATILVTFLAILLGALAFRDVATGNVRRRTLVYMLLSLALFILAAYLGYLTIRVLGENVVFLRGHLS